MYYFGIEYFKKNLEPLIEKIFFEFSPNCLVEILNFYENNLVISKEYIYEYLSICNFIILDGEDQNLLRKIDKCKEFNEEVVIIVITSNVNIADEIMKIDNVNFCLLDYLEKYLKIIILKNLILWEKKRKRSIYFAYQRKISCYKINEILYLKKENRRVQIHTISNVFHIYFKPYEAMETFFIRYGYLKISSNCVVNPRFIKDVFDNVLVLVNEEELKISKKKRSHIKYLINCYKIKRSVYDS